MCNYKFILNKLKIKKIIRNFGHGKKRLVFKKKFKEPLFKLN